MNVWVQTVTETLDNIAILLPIEYSDQLFAQMKHYEFLKLCLASSINSQY